MEKLKVIFHILAEERSQIKLIKQTLEDEDCDVSFISETTETLRIRAGGFDIVVLHPTSTNGEWFDDLMTIKLKYPDLPVFVYCPEIKLQESITPNSENKLIYLVKDLNSLKERTREMLNKTKESRKSILLVDDDENTLNSYVRMLRKTPWEIFAASSGKTALSIIKENSIQLVITDIKMPEMHGIELVSQIRAHDMELPIVVCSGFHGMKDDQNLQLYGVTDFVAKPVEPDVLKNKLNEILRA